MPIYEYTCEACKAQFEKLSKTIQPHVTVKCPKCGSTKTARSLSVFAVGAASPKSSASPPGTCGRCGGPGPCGMN